MNTPTPTPIPSEVEFDYGHPGQDFREQARLMAEAVYGPWVERFPNGTVTICSQPVGSRAVPKPNGFGPAATVPIADTEALLDALDGILDREVQTWVNAQVQASAPTRGRGDASNHRGFTALVVDVDTVADAWRPGVPSGHKADPQGDPAKGKLPLPTMAQAWEMVAEAAAMLGVPPTAVVKTSAEGLHAWWRLAEVEPTSSPRMAAWKAWWEDAGRRYGVAMDSVSCADVARVLRLPGQCRRKYDARVGEATAAQRAMLVRLNPSAEVDGAALDGIPEPVAVVKAKSRGTVGTGAARATTFQPTESEAALDALVPPLALLHAVTALEPVAGDGYGAGDTSSWPAGSTPTSADQGCDDQGWFVRIFSATMQGDLGLHSQTGGSRQLRASSTVRWAVGAVGEPAGSQRILAHHEVVRRMLALARDEGAEAAVEWFAGLTGEVTEGCGELAAWQKALFEAAFSYRAKVEVAEVADATAALAASLKTLDGAEHSVGDGRMKLVVGGPRHGTYAVKREKTEDGEWIEKLELLTDVVAVRTRRLVTYRAISGERPDEWDTLVIGPHHFGHRRHTVRGLSPADSVNAVGLITTASVGGRIPDQRQAREVATAILNAGLLDVSEEVAFGIDGWTEDGGRVRYVQPSCSVTSSGVDLQVRNRNDALVGGFARTATPEELALAPEMFRHYASLFPGAQGAAILGGIFGTVAVAPLRPTRGVVTFLWGTKDSGKTVLHHPSLQFVSWQPGPSPKPHVDLKELTERAVPQYADAHHESWTLLDDLRNSSGTTATDRKRDALAAQSAYGFMRAAYDGGLRLRGSATGEVGSGGAGRKRLCGSVTSEIPPAPGEASTVSKSLMLPAVRKGDIDHGFVQVLHPDGSPVLLPDGSPQSTFPANAWCLRWGKVANAVFASYVQWIARGIEGAGGLEAWTMQVDGAIGDLAATIDGGGRSMATVATALFGWQTWRRFLAENGVELPDHFGAAIRGLGRVNDEAQADSEIEARVAAVMQALLAASAGYLTGRGGRQPEGWGRLVGDSQQTRAELPGMLGWTSGGRDAAGGERWQARGLPLGEISPDGQWVRVTGAVARKAVVQEGGRVSLAEVRTALLALVPEDDGLRARVAAAAGGDGRNDPRVRHDAWGGDPIYGYPIPASVLGLRFEEFVLAGVNQGAA